MGGGWPSRGSGAPLAARAEAYADVPMRHSGSADHFDLPPKRGVAPVNVVEIWVSFVVAMDHAAMVAICFGAAWMVGAMISAIGSVCM